MISLAFEPAYDPFHAAFRALRPPPLMTSDGLNVERLKLLNIYLAEPQRCIEIRIPNKLKRAAKAASQCQPPIYGRRPSTTSFFNRMSPMQDAAIETLVIQGIFDADAYTQGTALRTTVVLPDKLTQRIDAANFAQGPLITFLYEQLNDFPLEKQGGLKDRTGVGEYRYDFV